MSPLSLRLLCPCFVLYLAAPAYAQQATIGGGLNTASSAFYEQSGVGFNFRGPGFFLQQNSFGLAIPPFGGFAPDAGATFGFGGPVGNWQASFNFGFGQGSRQSFTSQSPSVTVGNGATGVFSAGEWTPFVAGVVPVVGDVPFGPSGSPSVLDERLHRLHAQPRQPSAGGEGDTLAAELPADDSLDPFQRQLADTRTTSAGTPALSVAEIRKQRAAERAATEAQELVEIDRLVALAEAATEAGKPRVARIYYQQAARRAEGSLKQELQQKATRLGE